MRYFVLIILLINLVFANNQQFRWKVIESRNFDVIYHDGLRDLALNISSIAEEIYEPIIEFYDFKPASKTAITVKDDYDYTNGYALYFENCLSIWAGSGPMLLRGTHVWLRDVIVHEYAHLISLAKSRRFRRSNVWAVEFGVNARFRENTAGGIESVKLVNEFPYWYSEGVAQYISSKFGSDSWDSHRDMLLRTAVLSGKQLSLNRMGFFEKDFMGNELVYNQGFSIVKFMARKYGEEKLKDIAALGGKTIGFNKAIERVLNVSLKQLYCDWMADCRKVYQEYENKFPDPRLTKIIYENNGIEYFPALNVASGFLAFQSNFHHDYNVMDLYVMPKQGKPEKIAKNVREGMSWSPDGNKIVFCRADPGLKGGYYLNLYVYDISARTAEKVSQSKRCYYPAWSPDCKTIAAVQNMNAAQNILIFDLKTGKSKKITDNKAGILITGLSWHPNSRKVVYSKLNADNTRGIYIYNIKAGKEVDIIKDNFDNRDPVFTPDGRKLFFASDRFGAFNIFSYDIDNRELFQHTDVKGGAFCPVIDSANKRIIYSCYDADGFTLRTHLLGHGKTPGVQVASNIPVIKRQEPNDEFIEKDYKLGFGIKPDYIIPGLFIDWSPGKLKNVMGGFSWNFRDVLEKHDLTASLFAGKNLLWSDKLPDLKERKDLDAIINFVDGYDLNLGLEYVNTSFVPDVFL
ncbi:MAG: hypothetical protein ABIA63_10770, partial [bacterium]